MRQTLAFFAAAAILGAQETQQGSVEFGYRAVSGPAGSSDAYRSVVNLGEGPKLFHFDFIAARPKLGMQIWSYENSALESRRRPSSVAGSFGPHASKNCTSCLRAASSFHLRSRRMASIS